MATSITGWTYPATETITGSTTISQTDNKLTNAMNDLTAWASSTGTYANSGIIYTMNQNITGWQTEVNNAITNFSTTYYNKTETDARYLPIAGTATNSTNLNGQAASYYLNATNINAGTIGDAYLPATISSNITGSSASCTGNAATATTASNSTNLNGQAASYYLNASNINAGTIGDAYLPATISSDITGNAATATTATNALTLEGENLFNTKSSHFHSSSGFGTPTATDHSGFYLIGYIAPPYSDTSTKKMLITINATGDNTAYATSGANVTVGVRMYHGTALYTDLGTVLCMSIVNGIVIASASFVVDESVLYNSGNQKNRIGINFGGDNMELNNIFYNVNMVRL